MKLTYMWYHYILYFLFGFLRYFELGMNQVYTCRQTLAETNFLIGNRNNRRIVAATGKFAIFLWQYINLAQGIFLLSF